MGEGRRLLVLGNGPSLKPDHFPVFQGVDALGMNAAYRFWQRIGWYPTYYACLDPQVVVSHADAIAEMVRAGRFRRAFLHWHILKRHPDLAAAAGVTFLCQVMDGDDDPGRCAALKLEHRPDPFFRSAHPGWYTTGSASLRFAGHLGYRRIGVLGIDCRYQEILPEAAAEGGQVLRIERPVARNPNYFFDDYQQPGDLYQVPNPAQVDPNLHLHCIQYVAEDNAALGFGLDIRVLSRESGLHAEGVFPFQALGDFLGGD
ncbi:hypothetical protein [Niveispirillum sp. KHB5.9]|uniref:hypothetical protein n=1 Tax=Niveispirillum sp. KHB5.9 TaxID=3400269 RepID=UPI003A83C0CB